MPRGEKLSSSEECLKDVLREMTDTLCVKLTKMNEEIVLLVTEKLNECFNKSMELLLKTFQNMMTQVTKSMADCFQNALTPIMQRLDTIDKKTESGNQKGDENVNEAVKIATKTLLDFEREREEIKRRAGNVIVSGLPPKTNVKDVDLFGDFCGSNLTVKPRVVKVRRLGKDNKSSDAKLCVTLESAEAVNDVILSSRLLRASQDPEVRRVFMNRDLTRLQSEEAYTRRMAKRSSGARKEDTGQPFL